MFLWAPTGKKGHKELLMSRKRLINYASHQKVSKEIQKRKSFLVILCDSDVNVQGHCIVHNMRENIMILLSDYWPFYEDLILKVEKK